MRVRRVHIGTLCHPPSPLPGHGGVDVRPFDLAFTSQSAPRTLTNCPPRLCPRGPLLPHCPLRQGGPLEIPLAVSPTVFCASRSPAALPAETFGRDRRRSDGLFSLSTLHSSGPIQLVSRQFIFGF